MLLQSIQRVINALLFSILVLFCIESSFSMLRYIVFICNNLLHTKYVTKHFKNLQSIKNFLYTFMTAHTKLKLVKDSNIL